MTNSTSQSQLWSFGFRFVAGLLLLPLLACGPAPFSSSCPAGFASTAFAASIQTHWVRWTIRMLRSTHMYRRKIRLPNCANVLCELLEGRGMRASGLCLRISPEADMRIHSSTGSVDQTWDDQRDSTSRAPGACGGRKSEALSTPTTLLHWEHMHCD
jgi:hypothetical protein